MLIEYFKDFKIVYYRWLESLVNNLKIDLYVCIFVELYEK